MSSESVARAVRREIEAINAGTGSNLPACARVASLTKLKRALDEALAEVKAEIERAVPDAEREMIAAKMPRVPIDGELLSFRRVAFLTARDEFKSGRSIDMDRVRPVLRRARLGEFVVDRVNVQGLKSHVLELVEAGRKVPDAVGKVFKVDTPRQLVVTADASEREARKTRGKKAATLSDALGGDSFQ